MASGGDQRQRRNIFIPSDVQLLLDCVKLKANILENKKLNSISNDMKRKAWNEILGTYNARQTGGTRSLEELKNKYNNEKKAAKAALSVNAKGLRATGLNNPFDSDVTDNREEQKTRSNKKSDNDEDSDSEVFQNRNKGMKTTTEKDILLELKVEGLRLDNINKKKIGEKLDLENRKLQLEIKKLEMEIYPDKILMETLS